MDIVSEPQENYKTGYISLYRSIKKHWIWMDPIKFQWWIDILLTVNHSDNKINIGYELFECKRGQSIQSLQSWGKTWNVSKDTVRNFFKLLEKDDMILTENLKNTTRLTICNYDSYQLIIHAKQTPSKRQANAKQTPAHPNNNDNNDNNDNGLQTRAYLFGESLKQFITQENKEDVIKFWNHWTQPEQNKKNPKLKFELEKTWDTKKRLITWINNSKKWNK